VSARAPFLVCLALFIGCRSEPSTIDPARVDLSLPQAGGDAGADMLMCGAHDFVEVALDDIELLGGSASANLGTALRLRISYGTRRGCDEPGRIDVAVSPGDATDGVAIRAWVFRASTACTGAPQSVSRVVVIPADQLTNPRLFIRDASPSGTVTLTLAPTAAATTSCAARMPGQSCQADCECQKADAASLCLTLGPGLTQCGYSCSEDVDCPASANFCETAAGFLCGPSKACRAASDCSFGQTAVDCRCAPLAPMGPGVCRCDGDCGAGRICVGSVCMQPCVTKLDCPKASDPTTLCATGCQTGIPGP
jgi:hypothetical protein